VRPGSNSALHAVLKLEALAGAVDKERSPLSVAFALDVSGPMNGPPLEHVVLSVEKLVDLLESRDRVGVCAFASDVTEVMPLSLLEPPRAPKL
jgi:Ca-activated chloride channel homolog